MHFQRIEEEELPITDSISINSKRHSPSNSNIAKPYDEPRTHRPEKKRIKVEKLTRINNKTSTESIPWVSKYEKYMNRREE